MEAENAPELAANGRKWRAQAVGEFTKTGALAGHFFHGLLGKARDGDEKRSCAWSVAWPGKWVLRAAHKALVVARPTFVGSSSVIDLNEKGVIQQL